MTSQIIKKNSFDKGTFDWRNIFIFKLFIYLHLLNLNFFENLNLGFNDKGIYSNFFLVMFIFVRSI